MNCTVNRAANLPVNCTVNRTVNLPVNCTVNGTVNYTKPRPRYSLINTSIENRVFLT